VKAQEEPTTDFPAPAESHARRRREFEAEMQRLSTLGNRYQLVRLSTFLAGVALLISGYMQSSTWQLALGAAATLAFFVAVWLHARTISAEERARIRRDLHTRHLARIGHEWARFASTGEALLPKHHAYAWDIDIVGPGSLFQRIDVTHTHHGERTLAAWLSHPADLETARARQDAVWELASAVEFRQEVEAAGTSRSGERLDARGLDALARMPVLFATRAWLRVAIFVLPLITLAVAIAGQLGFGSPMLWLAPVLVQIALNMAFGGSIRHTLDIVESRAPLLESLEAMLLTVERATFRTSWLVGLQKRIAIGDVAPSAHMRRLARWVGFAEFRQNPLFHVPWNALTLWDLHMVYGLERFVRDVGARTDEWLEALGELEAASSLAALTYLDEAASRPELAPAGAGLSARALAHPLLPPDVRIENDVTLRGPGTALVVTGSNMAGKSTLLRAVGQNIALALAGGPVIAEHMSVPSVRLRASMRADDSLESGASYFHAELTKLKRVIERAEVSPPVFFLLDELLRGTNARARHIGAKAVLLHLLERHGFGLCATHDVELAALGDTDPARIENVHFTDVVVEGEMRFDYKLRPGIVRTSNALRLLAMAGIDVPERDQGELMVQLNSEVGEGAR
jgi:MutS domain V